MLSNVVDLEHYPIDEPDEFAADCKTLFQKKGMLMLPGFIRKYALDILKAEAAKGKTLAYFCKQTHTAYLSLPDPAYPDDHPRNIQVVSSKGCITDDQVPETSLLRLLYNSPEFQQFLCIVLEEPNIYPYADPLSSINIHYYEPGQELGWHFDNSSFAITLMLQAPESGGELEYVPRLRDSVQGDMNYDGVGAVLEGSTKTEQLTIADGALVLFRGRDTLHRVAPVTGNRERIQVVLAYNTKPGVSLENEARLAFYGRTE